MRKDGPLIQLVTLYSSAAVVAERLSRLLAKVLATSSPLHALIKLNKHRNGPTPRQMSALHFEDASVGAPSAASAP